MSDLAVGLMSGTSLDGVDAALVRLTEPDGVELVAFHTRPYTPAERAMLLHAIGDGTARDLASLHVILGGWFVEAVAGALERAGAAAGPLAFVASHGQTIWHSPGHATMQLGDPAVLAEHLGVKVVSDFRSRDIAAGGQGAPLVPIADAMLFGNPDGPRVLLNIGGMANVTYVPRRGSTDGVIAFDTGPGVAVIDAVVRRVDANATFDTDGIRAARGRADAAAVERVLRHPYFEQAPPKSTGRETFGEAVADDILTSVSGDDAVATAVEITARSIADQCARWLSADPVEVVVSGGGARNPALLRALTARLGDRPLTRFDNLFFDGDAKEAVTFAYLGWLALRGVPGNVPSATGAKGPRVLGTVTAGG